MIVAWGTSETVGQWDSETVKTAVICRLSAVGLPPDTVILNAVKNLGACC